MMDRRAFLAAGAALAVSGCQLARGGIIAGQKDVPPGWKPAPKSEEAGLWLRGERAEEALKAAPNRIRDPALNELVADVLCRVTGKHCPHLRSYILRIGASNAMALPHGMIEVWSGFLLRVRNESQLAMVLGHEFGHFLRRHSLQRQRDIRLKTDIMAFMNLGWQASGAPVELQDFINWLEGASIGMFSREHEREADRLGFEYAVRAGYAPRAGAEIWRQFIEEREAGGEDEPEFDIMLSTHPMDEERAENLEDLAKQHEANKATAPDRLREVLRPLRPMLLADQVNLGHFKRSNYLFDKLMKDDPAPGDILYAKGELYRRRAKEGDEDMALGFYHQAAESPGGPPEALRMVGLTRWRRGQTETAREYFLRYLERAPEARDREMILSYLKGA